MSTAIQDDEIAALRAIYDEDFQQAEGAETSFSILVRSEGATLSLDLSISLQADYPEVSPPVYQLKNALWLTKEEKEHIERKLQAIYRFTLTAPCQCNCPCRCVISRNDNRGDVVVYQWVEWIREYLKTREQESEQDDVVSKPLSSSPEKGHHRSNDSSLDLVIVHGEPVTFKKSTFQAHVTSVTSLAESVRYRELSLQIEVMMTQLKMSKKIATATHNILAYRISVPTSPGMFRQDFDNDGESGAGSVLLHLLQVIDAQNLAVVVTRWFGGVLLHTDRFKYIKNVAQTLIVESGIGLQHHKSKQDEASSKKKRLKSK